MSIAFAHLEPVEFDPFAGGQLERVLSPTSAQREIWITCAMDASASLAYNLSLTVGVHGHVDQLVLGRAVRKLVERHESLRLTFSADGRTASVQDGSSFEVELVDLRSNTSPEEAFQELLRRECSTAYDLVNGPLFRATIVVLHDAETRLLLGAHHIVCDGWSLAVLLRELEALYVAELGGIPPVLGPASSFAAYAASEPEARRDDDIAYFRNLLGESPAVLELPTDHPRRPGRSLASDVVTRTVEAELYTAIKQHAARAGVTPFVALFTVWSALLARLSGQSAFSVGLPVGMQNRLGLQDLVGQCTHLIPVPVCVDPQAALGNTMRTLRGTVLDVCDHPFATLGDLLPKLGLPRDPTRHPLLSVLFNLDAQFSRVRPRLGSARATVRPNPRAAETFEMFLNAYEDEAGNLVLDCQYATELWEAQTISSWLGGLDALLRAFAESPEIECGRAPIVSTSDLTEMVEAWNRTERPLEGGTVLDLVQSVAMTTPDRVAVRDSERALTYAEVIVHARRVAAELRARHVQEGDRVAICVERSAWLPVLALGVWGAGAAYIPVDPAYAEARVADVTRRAKLTIVDSITQPMWQRVAGMHARVDELVHSSQEESLSARASDDAYVIYTSGTTGVPKGVMVTHDNLLNLVTSMRTDPGVSSADTVAAVVTFGFDIAGFELFVPLTVGATIAVASDEEIRDGRELAEFLSASGITIVQATPATFRSLRAPGYVPSGLKALVGGEALPPDLAAWLLEHGASVTNCYGPTETTIWSAIHAVDRVAPTIPIGRPIANTRIYVLDTAGQPVPKGCFGEIVIAGRGVARGYLDEPELTRARFVDDPWGQADQRAYRTGDIGRWRHDGVLEIAGRNDDQVKIRGHRIELAEVETALAALPGVLEAAAAVIRASDREPRLGAFLVLERGASVTPTEVRRHLRTHLPEAMIPATVLEVPSMPRNLSGKTDRKALVGLALADSAEQERARVAPATPTERDVAELFSRLLRVPSVSTFDNFFEMGGDSISCVEASVALESRCGVRVPPREILLRSVGDIARFIEGQRQGNFGKHEEVSP